MSEYPRRPIYSPALGIPDLWTAFGRAAAVQTLVSNKQWTTNAAPVVGTGANIIVATLAMVAKVTGRFRVRLGGVISSTNSAGGDDVSLGVSHGVGVTAADYAQPAVQTPATGLETAIGIGWVSLIVDFSSVPISFTAALGSTTALNLIMNAPATVEFQTHGIEFEAEEF